MLAVAALALAAAMFGQTIPGRYVVELAGEPAGRQPARRTSVRAAQAASRRAVAAHGALIVEIELERVAEAMQIPGAGKLHEVRRVRKLLDRAVVVHKVTDV